VISERYLYDLHCHVGRDPMPLALEKLTLIVAEFHFHFVSAMLRRDQDLS